MSDAMTEIYRGTYFKDLSKLKTKIYLIFLGLFLLLIMAFSEITNQQAKIQKLQQQLTEQQKQQSTLLTDSEREILNIKKQEISKTIDYLKEENFKTTTTEADKKHNQAMIVYLQCQLEDINKQFK